MLTTIGYSMEYNGIPLNSIEVGKVPLKEFSIIYGEDDDFIYRAYLKVDTEYKNFTVYVVEFVSADSKMSPESLCVSEVMHVEARFDGIRHVHFNREGPEGMPGYWYYPDWKEIVKIFQLVEKLESKYCDADL